MWNGRQFMNSRLTNLIVPWSKGWVNIATLALYSSAYFTTSKPWHLKLSKSVKITFSSTVNQASNVLHIAPQLPYILRVAANHFIGPDSNSGNHYIRSSSSVSPWRFSSASNVAKNASGDCLPSNLVKLESQGCGLGFLSSSNEVLTIFSTILSVASLLKVRPLAVISYVTYAVASAIRATASDALFQIKLCTDGLSDAI